MLWRRFHKVEVTVLRVHTASSKQFPMYAACFYLISYNLYNLRGTTKMIAPAQQAGDHEIV